MLHYRPEDLSTLRRGAGVFFGGYLEAELSQDGRGGLGAAGVTLLAMRNADGAETLGARLDDDTVLDIAAAQTSRRADPGERRQSSNTSLMIFNPQKLTAYISRMWTLEPGDIIWSGTPQGVILGYPKEKQVWLKAGDEIVSTIEKLGSLRFKLA